MNFRVVRSLWMAVAANVALAGVTFSAQAEDKVAAPKTVRFATFNASLNRGSAGALIQELSTPDSAQPRVIAEIIQRVAPDVVLINEFDFDAQQAAIALFQKNYLGVAQADDVEAIEYPYVFVAPSNTGIPSGFDFDRNGSIGGGGDALGFGFFEGQFAMVLLSKYPILWSDVRTFQNFLWKDMPGALLPDDVNTPEPNDWYSTEALEIFRLSSKSHWDVPVVVDGRIVHVLASHPTPPVFDGPEDRNGRRNHDEIRFWADYISAENSAYIYDDNGVFGGLAKGESFVIVGDLNADPFDGDSVANAANQLVEHNLINNDVVPSSDGAVDASNRQGSDNTTHAGNPKFDTADFGEGNFGPGNLRVDYVLPSKKGLNVKSANVFWPVSTDPLFRLAGDFPFPSSDHRAVYIDAVVKSRKLKRKGRPVVALEFLGEATLPTRFAFEGTEVGGLSGIDYLGEDTYVVLSDDRSTINPARFYKVKVDLTDGRLNQGDVQVSDVVTLLDVDGQAFGASSVDPEAIRLNKKSGTLFWTSEGDANAGQAPFVREMKFDGRFVSEFPLPDAYVPSAGKGIRQNLAFESLTQIPGTKRYVTATENALVQDGAAASVSNGSPSRVLVYKRGKATKEYVYVTDPVAFAPVPATAFSTNGLVELLALNKKNFLAVERSFSVGVGNTIRVYLTSTKGATDVSGKESIPADVVAMSKTLLLDMDVLGITLDNIEGVTFGPKLADGSRTLVFVSDNNFNESQFTQFLAFKVIE